MITSAVTTLAKRQVEYIEKKSIPIHKDVSDFIAFSLMLINGQNLSLPCCTKQVTQELGNVFYVFDGTRFQIEIAIETLFYQQ